MAVLPPPPPPNIGSGAQRGPVDGLRPGEIWLQAWLVLAGTVNCVTPESATRWADKCLSEWLARFNANGQSK